MTSQLSFQVAGGQPCFIRNREFGDVEVKMLGQATGLTDRDQVFVYDLALTEQRFSMKISNVARVVRDRLQAWFDDEAKGVHNPWTLTIPGLSPETGEDTPRQITNCRFAHSSLAWESLPGTDGWYSVSLEIFKLTEGPTGPPTTGT